MATLRDDLLVTAGARAAHMEWLGSIDLPSGSRGETELADFIVEVCDRYINKESYIPFDEYIEKALMEKYGDKED